MTKHNNPSSPHWHILGAGAIGGLWASYLFKAGRPVTLLLRDAQRLADYRQAGGIIAQLGASAELLAIPADCPQFLDKAAPIQHLLITTKAQQSLAALEAIAPRLADKPTVLLLQNGLGVAQSLRQRLPGATLLQGSTTEGAYRNAPFALVHAGRGQTLIGQSGAEHDPARLSDADLAHLAASLSPPPLAVALSEDIDALLWRKLAINCAINPLTAIYRCRNGELLDNPVALAQLQAVVEEIHSLSLALGREAAVADLLPQVLDVARNTGLNRSSMLQDIEAGRPSEIDFITGYLCRLGREAGVALPVNEALLQRLGGSASQQSAQQQ